MAKSNWGAETRADGETNDAKRQQLHQRLDTAIGRVAERPLCIRMKFDPIDRSTEPTVSLQVQGAAERFPPNVRTPAQVLHRETSYRVSVQRSQGQTEVWPH